MKDQINTIREALTAALSDDQPYIEACKQALDAVDQLEAMVGAQEPVGEVVQAFSDLTAISFADNGGKFPPVGTKLYAAPVAQQPQCHKRANDYCKCSRKAMLCDGFGSAQQPQATCITITHAQAAELMLMFSGAEPDTEITLLTGDGHSGPGLYAYYEEYPEEGAEKLDATELPAQQPQAEMHRYSPDGEGGMEVDSLGAWVKLQDVKQPQAEAITEAAIDAYLDDYEMRGETEDGRDACYTPSEGEKFLIKDAIMGLLAEVPLNQPQAEAVPAWTTEQITAVAQPIAVAIAENCRTAPQLVFPHLFLGLKDLLTGTAPQQAEAVPPGYVLVPVAPDETWAYRVIRHHQPNLDVGCKAWLDCLEELLYWHEAIAAAKKEAVHE